MRETYYKWRLKNQKMRALFEIKQDLSYLMRFKSDMYKYDEGKARKRMVELKKIENRTDVENAELDAVLNVIAESKAVKNEVEKTTILIKDIENYITLL
jgi:hypothetical protein